MFQNDAPLIELLNASKVGSIAYGVNAMHNRKHRPVRTPITMSDARKKEKSELEIEPHVAMNFFVVEVIPVESLPNKVLLYMD